MNHVTIPHLLQWVADHTPQAIAIQDTTHEGFNYKQLNVQQRATVVALRQLGIEQQDRIALALPNGSTMAAAFLAIASSTTCAPLNPAYRAPEFEHYLSDLQPKALILPQGSPSPARTVAQDLNIPIWELYSTSSNELGCFGLLDVQGNDLIDFSTSELLEKSITAQPTDIALVLHTSGTTARPKIVPLTHQNLCRSAANIVQTLGLSNQDCCLNVMPLFHIHGLVASLLATLAVGGKIVCTPGFDAANFFLWLEQLQPTWYSAVPTIHQAVLEQANHHPHVLHHLRLIRSSSAALPPAVMTALEQCLGVPVIEAYGMTEAAHQMASNPLPPQQRKAASVGMAAGPELAIMDEKGNLLSPGAIGEVVIRGQNVTSGYDNNPTANAQSFTHGWFRTGDQGYLDAEGYLYLQGRLKEIINRGGEKIVPQEVDNVLLELPGIRQAVTFAVPHPTLGSDVATAVVLQQGVLLSPVEIRWSLFERLADFKVPSQVIIVNEVPKGATGKLQRIGLAEKLQEQLKSKAVAPQTDIEKTIATIFATVLQIADISIHDNFFALGGDSLRGTQVANHLSAHWGIELASVEIFRKPTITELAPEIVRLIAKIPTALAPSSTLRRNNHGQPVPLSYGQQRIWLLQQLDPTSFAYHSPITFRIQGKLNIPAVQQALKSIVERHESLRTNIVTIAGDPMQIVTTKQFELSQLDLRGEDVDAQNHQLTSMLHQFYHQPFDLELDLMLRSILIQIQECEYIWQIVLHHIACDGWSLNLFIREFCTLYSASIIVETPDLPELPIQYSDFAVWQRHHLSGQEFQDHLEYWRTTLKDVLPLSLPTDYPRPVLQTANSQRHNLAISSSLTQALRALSQEQNATLFMTLLAAFQLLLSRLSGQDDIVVGSPLAGRHSVVTEKLIGCFINTLVLRTNLSNNPSFCELLARVRQGTIDAYTHQAFPFEKLVEVLQPQRDLSRNPIFQVLINMFSWQHQTMDLPGLTTEFMPIEEPAKFDLTLYIREQPEILQFELLSNADLFCAERMAEMLRQFELLLVEIVADPYCAIDRYSLVTPTLAQRLPNLSLPLPEVSYEPISTTVKQWAEQNPQHIAIRQGEDHWTYQQLLSTAQSIAQQLLDIGVTPGAVVAVTGERSFGLIASLLGVFWSGGILLTLDPLLPTARQQMMLKISDTQYLINVGSALPEDITTLPILTVAAHLVAEINLTPELPQISAAHPAYIFFTSGTTGIPKGVLGLHKGLAHFLQWQRQTFAITPQDRIAQLTGLSFDVVLRDIFLALSSGATLYLPPTKNGDILFHCLDWLEEQHITVIHTVPTLAKTWLSDSPQNKVLTHLRWIFFAGEPLTEQLVKTWFTSVRTSAQMVNLYGPTETTLAKCFYAVQSPPTPGVQPIGAPLPNTEVWISNQHGGFCGVGETGEIVIRTPYRTQGYLNTTAADQQRFIINQWRRDPSDLIYYTGDLGRYAPNGLLEILGRQDHQIKIRGMRIELSEIEAVLSQHPQVQSCVVSTQTTARDELIIVAFVVIFTNTDFAPSLLREYLQQKLPAYMVPTAFEQIASLPLTNNGKVDRQSLPSIEFNQSSRTRALPTTSLELKLAQIWQQVLQIKDISINDNFFELGGHSLLATNLLAKIRQEFKSYLPLSAIFQAPTIAELTKVLSSDVKPLPWYSLVPIQSQGSRPILFAIHHFHYQDLSQALGVNQPIYGLHYGISEPINKNLILPPLEKLAAHYIEEMRSLQPTGPYFLMGFSFGGTVAYEMAQQLLAQGQQVQLLVLFDTTIKELTAKRNLLSISKILSNIWQAGLPELLLKIQYQFQLKLQNLGVHKKPLSQPDTRYFPHTYTAGPLSTLLKDYQLQPYPGKVLYFKSLDADVTSLLYHLDPREVKWRNVVHGELEVLVVPADHLGILQDPHVQIIAHKLSSCIDGLLADLPESLSASSK